MGLCHPNREDTIQSPKIDEADDSASTSKVQQISYDFASTPKILENNPENFPKINFQTVSDLYMKANENISCSDSPGQRKANIAIKLKQQKYQSEQCSSINIEDIPQINMYVKSPSQINESIIGRWNQATYSPRELFININYNDLFAKE